MKRNTWMAILVLVAVAALVFSGCWRREDSVPESGEITFHEPEGLPIAVKDWMEGIEEPVRDWMVVEETAYVAVSRGRVPHPGHGVVVENISFEREGSAYVLTVSASYTAPEPSRDYPQVPAYPVALVAFSMEQLPGAILGEITFNFLVDESDDAVFEEYPRHTLVLYFGTADGNMVRIYRSIRAPERNADLIVAELMAGPAEPGVVRVLPEGTRLAAVRDGEDPTLVRVDFSEEILNARGTLGEMLAIYSVVNSLLDNELGFERVLISVAGESRELGHLDITEPLTFDDALVIEDK